jgi:hypothetical protein
MEELNKVKDQERTGPSLLIDTPVNAAVLHIGCLDFKQITGALTFISLMVRLYQRMYSSLAEQYSVCTAASYLC